MSEPLSPLATSLEQRRGVTLQSLFSNKSYVVRNTRMKPKQHAHFEKVLELWGIQYNAQLEIGIDQNNYNTNNKNHGYTKACLDIGFGAGETLIDIAEKNSDTCFFGIETYKQGIAGLYNKIQDKALKNIRIIHHDAVQVLAHMVPSHSFDAIHIFFPDPWHKKRHNKRRLLHKHFLSLCYEILKPQGVLWIVTDWQDYMQDIKKHILLCNESGLLFEQDHTSCDVFEKERKESRFETRGKIRQHTIYPLVYRKTKN